MRYYWSIKFKDYKVADLLIENKAKEYIESEWVKEPENRLHQTFKYNNEVYSYSSIDSITQTSQKVTDLTKMLYSGEAMKTSNSPLVNEDGEVVTMWCKRLVTIREYENLYSKHTCYYLLDKADNGVWVGVRIAVMENGNRPDTVEECTEVEADRLWRYLTVH